MRVKKGNLESLINVLILSIIKVFNATFTAA